MDEKYLSLGRRLHRFLTRAAAVPLGVLLAASAHVAVAKTVTACVPLHFLYSDGLSGVDLNTDWLTIIPYEAEGKLSTGAGTMPFSLDLSASLFIRFDDADIYSYPHSLHPVSFTCWIEPNDHPLRTEIRANFGVELGVAVRNALLHFPTLSIGKDFRLADSRDGRCPLGTNTLGCIDSLDFISLPLSDMVGKAGAKTLESILDGADNSGVNMASISLLGEMVVKGDSLDVAFGTETLHFTEPGIAGAKLVTLNIPQGSLGTFQIPVSADYQFDVYNGIGLQFCLVDPLTLTIHSSLLARHIFDADDYTPPTVEELSSTEGYVKLADNIDVPDEKSGGTHFRLLNIPEATAPKLPDFAISEIKVSGSVPDYLFADESSFIKVTINNYGWRSLDEASGRIYLSILTNGVQAVYMPIRDPTEGAMDHNLAPGESFTAEVGIPLPAGSCIDVDAEVTAAEIVGQSDDGDDLWAQVDADMSNNLRGHRYEVYPDQGRFEGRVHTLPDGLGGGHYVSNFVVRLSSPDFVAEQRTDEKGHWSFRGVPTGIYDLDIIPPAAPPPGSSIHYWGRSYEIYHPMGKNDNFETDPYFSDTFYDHYLLQMQRVQGRVLFGGHPVEGVRVTFGNPAFASAQTDSEGMYSLENVVPRGEFTVGFEHPDYSKTNLTVRMEDYVTDSRIAQVTLPEVEMPPDTLSPHLDTEFPTSSLIASEHISLRFRTYDHDRPTDRWRWTIYQGGHEVQTSEWESCSIHDEETWTNILVESSLPDGSYQLRLEVADGAGNLTVNPWDFTLDTTPPTVTVSIAGGTNYVSSASADVDVSIPETFSVPVRVRLSKSSNEYTLPAGSPTLHLPNIQLTDHPVNATIALTATVWDPAGNAGSGSASVQVDTQPLAILGAVDYTAPGILPVFYHWPPASGSYTEKYSEYPYGDQMVIDAGHFRTQRFVLSSDAEVNALDFEASPVNQPGNLMVRITDALSLETSHTLALATFADSGSVSSSERHLFDRTAMLHSGQTYYLIVTAPSATGGNHWNYTVGLSAYGGSGQPRFDAYDGSGTSWQQAPTADDAEAEEMAGDGAFYQIAFSLYRFVAGEGQARWSLDSTDYLSEPWSNQADAPSSITLSGAGAHYLWVEYTNAVTHAHRLSRDSIIVDASPPVAELKYDGYDPATRHLFFLLELSDTGGAGVAPSFTATFDNGHTVSLPSRSGRFALACPETPVGEIHFTFRDAVGNETTQTFPLEKLGDIFPPQLQVELNGGNPYANGDSVPLRIHCSEPVRFFFGKDPLGRFMEPPIETDVSGQNAEPLLRFPVIPTTESPVDGEQAWSFWTVDDGGNTSAVIRATVVRDTHAPVFDKVLLRDPTHRDPFTPETTMALKVSAHDKASPILFRYSMKDRTSTWTNAVERWLSITNLPPDLDQYSIVVDLADSAGHTVQTNISIPHVRPPAAPVPTVPADYEFTGPASNGVDFAAVFSDPDPGDRLSSAFWKVEGDDGKTLYFTSLSNATHIVSALHFGTYRWSVRFADRYALLSESSTSLHFGVGGSHSDEDGDRLPDHWEYEHFHDFNQTDGGDRDADRFSNYAEYIAGTDPSNPSSALRLRRQRLESGTQLLSWPTVPGRTYDLLWTPDLRRGFHLIQVALPVDCTNYLDTAHSGDPAAFYQLLVRLPDEKDHDADGMPDRWEHSYFGDDSSAPMEDADADGVANLEEYIAGTDPTNSASVFHITQHISGNQIILEWTPTAPNRRYTLLYSSAPGNPCRILQSDLPPERNCSTNALPAASGIYSVEVRYP